jgi:hypothetical protein
MSEIDDMKLEYWQNKLDAARFENLYWKKMLDVAKAQEAYLSNGKYET